MNTYILNPKGFVLILVSILMVTLGTQSISYAQEANPTITASVKAPLTEATLHGSVITLTLSGGTYEGRIPRNAVSLSGIDGVTFDFWDVRRVSDTELTVKLTFSGDFDSNATLTFTVGTGAIVDYDGNALTATLPVTAVEESLEASTAAPLTEANLDGSIITLTLTGRQFDYSFRGAISVSGIDGVTFDDFFDVDRVSDTEVTIELAFASNIDTDTTLTFTVEAGAIARYNGNSLTATLPVTAVEESLEASTEAPLTDTTLHGSIITLTLSGRTYEDWIRAGTVVSLSGIDGVTFNSWDVERVSDTELTVELTFSGDFDSNATLTFTVGAGAIVGYNGNALTATLPVTAVQVSVTASVEAPLTEATLDGSIITLTLTGRQFADYWRIGDALSFSGIEGVTVARYDGAVDRVSDTVVTVELVFDGTDFDTDTMLILTVGADAIAVYDKVLSVQLPVTARQQSNATVSISPSPVVSPNIGEPLTFNLNIAGGENVAGYQATISFNRTALRPVNITNGDYLPRDAFFMDENFYREVRLAATTLAEASNGDGTLATLTFEVEDFKPSMLTLSEVYLVEADGTRWETFIENGEVTIPPELENAILGDINRDGVVNIQDLTIVNVRFGQTGENSADINGDGIVNIVDLVLVAGAFGNGAAAPALHPQSLEMLTAADIQRWLSQAQRLELTDTTFLRGILFLEQLLAALIPEETVLLANYPNPFNPETWIPYRLSKPADVTLTIYAVDGQMVRRLSLGHQPAGIYQTSSRAAYWDGRNAFGEPVASGVYFYTITAGDFTATRKMLIRK